MRKILTFDVSGTDQKELEEKALHLYRQFLDDEEAELPHSAVIDAKPEYEVHSHESSESMLVRWTATVSITTSNSPY